MAAVAFVIALFLVGGLLARHNLSLGRGDRVGAMRLARYLFVTGVVAWALGADHAFDVFQEFEMAFRDVGLVLLFSAITWMLYLAIEPYVRRRWPHTLISWTRLLSGRVQDPLIGRDALIGVAAGAVMAVAIALFRRLPAAVGGPATAPAAYGLDAFLGAREIVGRHAASADELGAHGAGAAAADHGGADRPPEAEPGHRRRPARAVPPSRAWRRRCLSGWCCPWTWRSWWCRRCCWSGSGCWRPS